MTAPTETPERPSQEEAKRLLSDLIESLAKSALIEMGKAAAWEAAKSALSKLMARAKADSSASDELASQIETAKDAEAKTLAELQTAKREKIAAVEAAADLLRHAKLTPAEIEALPATQRARFREQIADALLLKNYAVAQGVSIDAKTMESICDSTKFLSDLATKSDCEEFAKAYAELARLTAPVTAATLKATDDHFGATFRILFWRWRMSESRKWSRKLLIYAAVMAALVIFVENFDAILLTYYKRDESTDGWLLRLWMVNLVFSNVARFVYGGLGAAVYLLRSADKHLNERTFDSLYVPEYYNRMMLGFIAGGTINLLISQVLGEDGNVVHISAAALAFIAGYNADLLYKAIERMSEALLPKVGLDSIKRAQPVEIAGVSLPALIKALDEAKTPEAKAAVQSVISAVTAHITRRGPR